MQYRIEFEEETITQQVYVVFGDISPEKQLKEVIRMYSSPASDKYTKVRGRLRALDKGVFMKCLLIVSYHRVCGWCCMWTESEVEVLWSASSRFSSFLIDGLSLGSRFQQSIHIFHSSWYR